MKGLTPNAKRCLRASYLGLRQAWKNLVAAWKWQRRGV